MEILLSFRVFSYSGTTGAIANYLSYSRSDL